MPKVSDARREAQARHIRLAAERCFARSGFHAASMDEIIAEAAMSSSTIYRYFPGGKQELVAAVSQARIGPLVRAIGELADAERPADVGVAFEQLFAILVPIDDYSGDYRERLKQSAMVGVHAWLEAGAGSEVGAMIRENLAEIQAMLLRLVENWQLNGSITRRLPAADVAALLEQVAFGLVVDEVLTSNVDVAASGKRLSVLLAP